MMPPSRQRRNLRSERTRSPLASGSDSTHLGHSGFMNQVVETRQRAQLIQGRCAAARKATETSFEKGIVDIDARVGKAFAQHRSQQSMLFKSRLQRVIEVSEERDAKEAEVRTKLVEIRNLLKTFVAQLGVVYPSRSDEATKAMLQHC